MTQRAQRQVRDVISPADSAKMVGYASEILDIPKEDIDKGKKDLDDLPESVNRKLSNDDYQTDG